MFFFLISFYITKDFKYITQSKRNVIQIMRRRGKEQWVFFFILYITIDFKSNIT